MGEKKENVGTVRKKTAEKKVEKTKENVETVRRKMEEKKENIKQ